MKSQSWFRIIAFYTVMACLLIPLVLVDIQSARHVRPWGVHYWPISVSHRNLVALCPAPRGTLLYCTDLKTGEYSGALIGQKVISASNDAIGKFNSQIWCLSYLSKDKNEFDWVDLRSGLPVITRELTYENYPGRSACIVNNHVISVKGGQIVVTDFVSGANVDSVAIEQNQKLKVVIETIPDSKCFLVSEQINFRRSVNEIHHEVLYELEGSKIRKLASWNCLKHWQFMSSSTGYVVSLVQDGTAFEVRDASTGAILSDYLPPESEHLLKIGTTIDATLVWDTAPKRFTDILTGRTLPVPSESELIARDVAGKRLITMHQKGKLERGWDCVVLAESSGNEIARFDVPLRHFASERGYPTKAFLYRSNQLVLATQSYGISIYDLSTGKLIREFDPFVWHEWSKRFAAMAFAVWCLIWLQVSTKLHGLGWLDFAVCSGLVVASCCIEAPYQSASGFNCCVCFGIFGSWLVAAISWLSFGKTRLSIRFQPLLLLIGLTFGLTLETIGRASLEWGQIGEVVDFVFGMLLLVVVLLISLLPLQWLGFQMEKESQRDASIVQWPEQRAPAVALRDLFLLTTVFAMLFTIARWMPAIDWVKARPRDWKSLTILVCQIAIPSLLAMWTATNSRSLVMRLGIWLIAIVIYEALAANVPSGIFRRELPLSTTLATLFCFYSYRLRGWRLRHANVTS